MSYVAVAAVPVLAGLVAGYILAVRRNAGRLPNRSRQQLQDALAHIAYEFVGLERSLRSFQLSQTQGGQPWIPLEAALAHARNLTDFFWAPIRRRRTHPNGVYAAHYVGDGALWTTIRDSLPQFPNTRYDAISAQLVHISIARTRNGAPDFAREIAQIANDLNTVWTRWRGEINSSPWASMLDAEVAHWRSVL